MSPIRDQIGQLPSAKRTALIHRYWKRNGDPWLVYAPWFDELAATVLQEKTQ